MTKHNVTCMQLLEEIDARSRRLSKVLPDLHGAAEIERVVTVAVVSSFCVLHCDIIIILTVAVYVIFIQYWVGLGPRY